MVKSIQDINVQSIKQVTEAIESRLSTAYHALEGQPEQQAALVAVWDGVKQLGTTNHNLVALLAGAHAAIEKAVNQRDATLRHLDREREAHNHELITERKYSIEKALRRLSGQIAIDTDSHILMPEARMVLETLAGLRLTGAEAELAQVYEAMHVLAEALGIENLLDSEGDDD